MVLSILLTLLFVGYAILGAIKEDVVERFNCRNILGNILASTFSPRWMPLVPSLNLQPVVQCVSLCATLASETSWDIAATYCCCMVLNETESQGLQLSTCV